MRVDFILRRVFRKRFLSKHYVYWRIKTKDQTITLIRVARCIYWTEREESRKIYYLLSFFYNERREEAAN